MNKKQLIELKKNKKFLEALNFLLDNTQKDDNGYYYIKLDDGTLFPVDSISYATLWNLRQLLQQCENGNISDE